MILVVLEEGAGSTRIAYFTVSKRSWDEWWDGVAATLNPRAVHPAADGTASSTLAIAERRDRETKPAPSPFPEGFDDAWDDGSLDDLSHGRSSAVKV